MDEKNKLKRNYTLAAAVLGAVVVLGTAATAVFPTAWAFFSRPLLAGAGVALLWCGAAALWLCKDPARLLAKQFKRSLKLSLSMPLWLLFTLALLALPGDTAAMEQNLVNALGVLLLVVLVLVVPAATVVCEALAVAAGVRHMREAGEHESPLYREGPFALALVLCVLVVCICGFGVYYLAML